MPHDAFINRIRNLGRVYDEDLLARLASASLRALGPALPANCREQLAGRLSAEHAADLRAAGPEPDGALLALFSRAAELAELPEPAIRDLLPAVFGALALTLGERDLPVFVADLPEFLAPLFVIPDPEAGRRPPEYVHPARGATLSGGRPGSNRPLSDASPSRGHSASIARSDDPKSETRIASASGLSSERDGRTLADGRPGHRKPLAG